MQVEILTQEGFLPILMLYASHGLLAVDECRKIILSENFPIGICQYQSTYLDCVFSDDKTPAVLFDRKRMKTALENMCTDRQRSQTYFRYAICLMEVAELCDKISGKSLHDFLLNPLNSRCEEKWRFEEFEIKRFGGLDITSPSPLSNFASTRPSTNYYVILGLLETLSVVGFLSLEFS